MGEVTGAVEEEVATEATEAVAIGGAIGAS